MGIIVGTDKDKYETGDTLILSGLVLEKKMPVIAMRTFDTSGGILSANSLEIKEDDTFSKILYLDSPFYDEPGFYSITLEYGQLKEEILFEIIGDNKNEDSTEEEPIVPEVIEMFTDRPSYQNYDTITINGAVSAITEPAVLIGIYDPFGTPTGFYFGEIDSDMEFSTNFLVSSGVNFREEGIYTVIGHYGESKYEIIFEYAETIDVQPPIIENPEDTTNPTTGDNNQEDSNDHDSETEKPNKPANDSTSADSNTQPSNENTNSQDKSSNDKHDYKNLSVEDIELGLLLNQMTLNCENDQYEDTLSYYDDMGPALIRLCKYNEAIFFFDKSLQQDPNNIHALTNKGTALAKLGYFDKAIDYYDSALNINPEFIPALNNKANVLSKLGSYEEAIYFYKIALQTSPNYQNAQSNLEKTIAKVVVMRIPSSDDGNESESNLDSDKTDLLEVPKFIEPPPESPENSQTGNQSTVLDKIGNALATIGESIFGFIV